MINNRLVNACLIGAALLSLVFFLFPQIDISISAVFYDKHGHFSYKEEPFTYFIYELIPVATKLLVAAYIIYLLYILARHRSFKKMIKTRVFFLFLAAAIGPGIIVNYVLKDNFGRARPSQITEFKGDNKFSRPFEISNQCTTNCSFPSGHAAMGYYFTAVAYLLTGRCFSLFYISGIIFGSIVGLTRIMVGAHFASDVVSACFLILLINHLIYTLWKKIK
jgi:lipid A 4'-phosphatase